METMIRANPNGPETIQAYDDISNMVQTVGWVTFIQAFKGHNVKVARDFSQSFNGRRAQVRYLELFVDETFIEDATWFLPEGKRWLKNAPVKKIP
jgi:hypothetical protein